MSGDVIAVLVVFNFILLIVLLWALKGLSSHRPDDRFGAGLLTLIVIAIFGFEVWTFFGNEAALSPQPAAEISQPAE